MDSAAVVTSTQWQLGRGRGALQRRSGELPRICAAANPTVECISACQLFEFATEARSRSMPQADDVFPWLYGISPSNSTAASFLRLRYPGSDIVELLSPPKDSVGPLLVKFGDPDNLFPSIKGSIQIEDILARSPYDSQLLAQFIDTDMIEGLQLRNFAIQPAKVARIADTVLYCACPYATEEDKARLLETGLVLANIINEAHANVGLGRRTYLYPGDLATALRELDPGFAASLIVEPERQVDPFELGMRQCCEDINWENGLPLYEQDGVIATTAATEVLPFVWLSNFISMAKTEMAGLDGTGAAPVSWRTKVMCNAGAEPPSVALLDNLVRQSRKRTEIAEVVTLLIPRITDFSTHDFSTHEPEPDARAFAILITICKLLHIRSEQHPIIIISPDGYHLSSPFAVLQVMYSTGRTLADAMVYLHRECAWPLSFYPGEMPMLRSMEATVYAFSPVRHLSRTRELGAVPVTAVRKFLEAGAAVVEPAIGPPPAAPWLENFPGAFPSRVLDHLYLGAFEHANNPEMLRALGISRILSVGEKLSWLSYPILGEEVRARGFDAVRHVDHLQDDGVDSLLPHLHACLAFLADAEQRGEKTLVHCRKGVSRSAAVCIAEVMRARRWGLPHAYAHVRIHRLDVLIQPNMRLMYDLLKFEEQAPFLQGRTTDWAVLSREITRLNGEYEL